MREKKKRPVLNRTARLESIEERFLMTAQPLSEASINLDTEMAETAVAATPLSSAYDFTGLTTAQSLYGFTGAGQTVAVIDSGIAYDHPALGGGYGANYRVVGGYDFAENDTNPYDDGPAGSHGTHVAGIIGSTDKTSPGVAPGVDLVALRVFDDQGKGNFDNVLKALDWVDAHRNDYEFPITTVNLSIGSDWNATTVPSWSNLEASFKKLYNDGIFVSVAAGNSFTTYNAPGLSYPAASPYVVPVMAVDATGSLAYYSQRQDRAIAAPGSSIRSTVPDYVGNLNGKTDDFATYSGTSMAAPYLAGASTLVRQALQFVGATGINEDKIYSILKNTADTIYDSATKAYYSRVDVLQALNSIMPADDYGSTAATAASIAVSTSTTTLKGIISQTNDKDYFTFVASATGTAKFTATTADSLQAGWELVGGSGTVSGTAGNTFSFDVVAGKSYTVGLSTKAGIGHYTLSDQITSTAVSLGAIDFKQLGPQNFSSGEAWYALTATHDGIFTAEALYATSGSAMRVELYDAAKHLLATSATTTIGSRSEATVHAGDTIFVHLVGTNANASLRLTNLVSQSGSSVTVWGTAANDSFYLVADSACSFAINGVSYCLVASPPQTVTFNGGAGSDSAIVIGGAGADVATLRPGSLTLQGQGYLFQINDTESIAVQGGGGADRATFYDSAGSDEFVANSKEAWEYGSGYYLYASFFGTVTAYSQAGNDHASLYDTAGADRFTGQLTSASLTGTGYNNTTVGFSRVDAYSTGGGDQAFLYDTAGDDTFNAYPNVASMQGGGYANVANNFAQAEANATQGNDKAYFWDSLGNDTVWLSKGASTIAGTNYRATAKNFDWVEAHSSGGDDTAYFSDSAGNDTFGADPLAAMLFGDDYYTRAEQFAHVKATSSLGGADLAVLYDSAGDDTFLASGASAAMSGANYDNQAQGFQSVQAKFSTGVNTLDQRTLNYLFTAFGSWSPPSTDTLLSSSGRRPATAAKL